MLGEGSLPLNPEGSAYMPMQTQTQTPPLSAEDLVKLHRVELPSPPPKPALAAHALLPTGSATVLQPTESAEPHKGGGGGGGKDDGALYSSLQQVHEAICRAAVVLADPAGDEDLDDFELQFDAFSVGNNADGPGDEANPGMLSLGPFGQALTILEQVVATKVPPASTVAEAGAKPSLPASETGAQQRQQRQQQQQQRQQHQQPQSMGVFLPVEGDCSSMPKTKTPAAPSERVPAAPTHKRLHKADNVTYPDNFVLQHDTFPDAENEDALWNEENPGYAVAFAAATPGGPAYSPEVEGTHVARRSGAGLNKTPNTSEAYTQIPPRQSSAGKQQVKD